MNTARDAQPSIPVVAIGASAGGLEALRELISRIKPTSGAAYVIIQHLAPHQKSILHELLQAGTDLPVSQIASEEMIQPNQVYVVPPGMVASITNDRLHLTARDEDDSLHRPIDAFFRSLAAAKQRDAYCVILSGTGSDGSQGLRRIKAQGGFALVQDSSGARFPGMPDSAVSTGMVDFVLPAEQIAGRLDEMIRHRRTIVDESRAEILRTDIIEAIPRITELLRGISGNDFSDYKHGTLVRRIERRMTVLRLREVSKLLDLLEKDEDQARILAHEFLIGVTEFFRDPDAFDALHAKVVTPTLDRTASSVRIWVPGCSTGEEVYSLAILFLEEMNRRGDRRRLQVFGTDIDAAALIAARNGVYSAAAVENLSQARRDRFFTLENGQYRIGADLREACVFAPHNLVQDPPFSRLDLISCRNLMIYLSSNLQRLIIPRFHFSLNAQGYLFLGPSEGLSGQEGLFHVIDKDHRIFSKNADREASYSSLTDFRPRQQSPVPIDRPPQKLLGVTIDLTREELTERDFLRHHAAPFCLLSPDGQVLYLSQGMARFVRPSQGTPSSLIDAYLISALRLPVRTALADAVSTSAAVTLQNIMVLDEGSDRVVDVTVAPSISGNYMLVLKDVRTMDHAAIGAAIADRGASDRDLLEAENIQLRKQLAVTLQEYETSGQELKSSNEELMSMNEELQSSNEELETSREELQSINEELETVNSELQENNRQLTRANSDLKNLFESTDLAVLFLDRNFCVRNFTSSVTRIFGIRPRDIGRPISDLSSRIDYPDLVKDAHEVDTTLRPLEREVVIAETNETFLLRIKPYRTTENVLDGHVLSFVDITSRKSFEETLKRNERDMAQQYAELENLYDTTPVGLCLVDSKMRWVRINETMAQINGYSAADHIGKTFRELLPDLAPDLERTYGEVFATGKPVLGIELSGETHAEPGALRYWVTDLYPVKTGDQTFAVGGCVREVTEQTHMLERIKAHSEQQRLLLGELQHRVKNTLATIVAISKLLLRGTKDPATYQAQLADRINAMSRTHDLLTQSDWNSASFHQLLRSEARPYETDRTARVITIGPDLMLSPQQAVSFGMALHELMTNAAKYGPLSGDSGHITVSTLHDTTGPTPRMGVVWQEVGGPAVPQGDRDKGFGSVVLDRVLRADLNADISVDYAPEGMRFTMTFVPGATS